MYWCVIWMGLCLCVSLRAMCPQVRMVEDHGLSNRQEPSQEEPKRQRSVTASGELPNYYFYQSHAFFGARAYSWPETSARSGGTFRYGDLAVEVSGLGLKTTDKDPYGAGTLPCDALEGQRISGELRQANEASEAVSQARSEFPATMSHEIRTPSTCLAALHLAAVGQAEEPCKFAHWPKSRTPTLGPRVWQSLAASRRGGGWSRRWMTRRP